MIALACWLLLMIQVYLKTHVTGTFEMTSIGIGPTEVRLMAIILNTTMFFTGIGGSIWQPTIEGQVIDMTIGSIIIAILAVLFLLYYIYQVTSTAIILAAHDEERLIRRREKEARKAEKARLKAEKKAARTLEKQRLNKDPEA